MTSSSPTYVKRIALVSILTCMVPILAFGDDRQTVVNAIEMSYASTRFDRIDVDFSTCKIRVRVEDDQACSADTNINAIEYFVDLRKNVVLIESARVMPIGDTLRAWVGFEARGLWADEGPQLTNYLKNLLVETRREFGWGAQAAKVASDRFRTEHPLDQLGAYEVAEYCNGGTSIRPEIERIRFHTSDPDTILSKFSQIAQQCLSSANIQN